MKPFFILLSLLASVTMFGKTKKSPTAPLQVEWRGTLKMDSAYHNPMLDFIYTADPTAVEYQGRLYVYGTNDQQQHDETRPDSANTYERINTLAMMSTNDMVNWTFHGLIPTKKLAPWIIASWAPTICSRVEEDGKTHFYLYFSNSGFGTGVLTATSPVGPWKSPLEKSIVDAKTPGVGMDVCFDPGVAIDDDGTGWLVFGGAQSRLARLGKDMLSFDSPFVPLPAQHHFEANELNFIGGRMVYTYNLDWQPKDDWKMGGPTPSICSMAYMLPEGDPLKTENWKYQHHYMRNPGEDGFEYCNNHTHLHKYQGKWYVFGHTMDLKRNKGIKGGFRNIVVENIEVDESVPSIAMSHYTRQGVSQTHALNPFERQEMETTFATVGIRFLPTETPGNMLAATDGVGAIKVAGVDFSKKARQLILFAQGKGQLDVRLDSPEGELIATTLIDNQSISAFATSLKKSPKGKHDLVFLLSGETLRIDGWQMK